MENQNNKVKAMAESGILSALITVVMLLNMYVPLFNILGFFICPVIVTVLYLRHGMKMSLLSVIVSFVLVAVLYSPVSAFISAVLYGFAGIALGYSIKARFSAVKSIAVTSIAFLLNIVLTIALATLFINKTGFMDLLDKGLSMTREYMQSILDSYKAMGVAEAQLQQFQSIMDQYTIENALMMLPGSVIIVAFAYSYINYIVSKAVLKKLKYKIADLPKFESAYIDNRIGALIIILLCIGIILESRGYKAGGYIFNSSIMVFQLIFLIPGMAVTSYYLRNKFNISKGFRVIIIALALFSQIGMFFVYLGIADMIFDFRKVDPNRIFNKKSAK